MFTPNSVHFAKQTCRPTYEPSTESSADFLQDYKVDTRKLELNDPITRFDAGCMHVFRRGPNEIVFTWQGYFLVARKAVKNR